METVLSSDWNSDATKMHPDEEMKLETSVPIRGGHKQLLFRSSIAILQLEGTTSTVAYSISKFLKKFYSVYLQSQFFALSSTSSPELFKKCCSTTDISTECIRN
jgi:hypothetical protein